VTVSFSRKFLLHGVSYTRSKGTKEGNRAANKGESKESFSFVLFQTQLLLGTILI
jgi:hypothetical protein